MEKVTKVSIGGVYFTLEKDAYTLLEQYLAELKVCYKNEDNVLEIIEDIEERIAELLLDKGLRERVVSYAVVENIINILGHPADIAGENFREDSQKRVAENRRRLYRNLENHVLGGVCGGLGAYFGVDPVLLRIIFVLLLFFLSALKFVNIGILIGSHGGSFGFMCLLYILLWIIIPPAKSVEERCAMKGESMNVDQIKRRAGIGIKSETGESGFARFVNTGMRLLVFFMGAFCLIIGFVGVVAGFLFCMGFEIFEGVSVIRLLDYVELGITNTVWIKLFAILSCFLPFIWLIYIGLCMCFKFKAPAWKPGLIIFVAWIVSLVVFIIIMIKALNPYYYDSVERVKIELPTNNGTIYVKMEDFTGKMQSKRHVEQGKNHYSAHYVKRDDTTGILEFVTYPFFRIVRHAPVSDGEPFTSYIECRYKKFHGLLPFDMSMNFNVEDIVSIGDSVICVKSKSYTKEKKYNGESFGLHLHVPESTDVKIMDNGGTIIDN